MSRPDVKTHRAISHSLCGSPADLGEDTATVRFTATDEMVVDDTGLVHGGFIFGAADHAAMLAINRETVVLGKAETKFLAPVVVGDELVASAKLSEVDGKKHFVDVDVYKGDATVFSGRFTCFVPAKHVLDTKGA